VAADLRIIRERDLRPWQPGESCSAIPGFHAWCVQSVQPTGSGAARFHLAAAAASPKLAPPALHRRGRSTPRRQRIGSGVFNRPRQWAWWIGEKRSEIGKRAALRSTRALPGRHPARLHRCKRHPHPGGKRRVVVGAGRPNGASGRTSAVDPNTPHDGAVSVVLCMTFQPDSTVVGNLGRVGCTIRGLQFDPCPLHCGSEASCDSQSDWSASDALEGDLSVCSTVCARWAPGVAAGSPAAAPPRNLKDREIIQFPRRGCCSDSRRHAAPATERGGPLGGFRFSRWPHGRLFFQCGLENMNHCK